MSDTGLINESWISGLVSVIFQTPAKSKTNGNQQKAVWHVKNNHQFGLAATNPLDLLRKLKSKQRGTHTFARSLFH